MKKEAYTIGCIADDFTGASDWASFYAQGGGNVVLYNGTPHHISLPTWADAAVIALKSRTAPLDAALQDISSAADWLEQNRATNLYFKYCSTFDSWPTGNIGPSADYLLKRTEAPYTLLCPSLPVNGRTVKNGELFVNGIPLDESPMKNHPITPMWSSQLAELMQEQSIYPCYTLPENIYKNNQRLDTLIHKQLEQQEHFYFVPDYTNDEQGALLAQKFWHLPLLTGGSGLAFHLAQHMQTQNKKERPKYHAPNERVILIAGSCSTATNSQVNDWLQKGYPAIEIDPYMLLAKEQDARTIWQAAKKHGEAPILFYSKRPDIHSISTNPAASAILETTFANLALIAQKNNVSRFIIAGGETSGSVTQALGWQSYHIGPSVAPGVPVLTPLEQDDKRLVLKSGNFGNKDFFERALKLTAI